MLQSQIQSSAADRLQQSPESLLAWLKDTFQDNEQLYEDFNWLGLAQGATLYAQQHNATEQQQQSLLWAEIAITVYEALSQSNPTPEENSYKLSEMNLRGSLIQTWGVQQNHKVLDPATISQWFFDSLTHSLEEAEQQTKRWQDAKHSPNNQFIPNNIETIRCLRHLKNRLSVIECLIDLEDWQPETELIHWYKLKPLLP